MVWENVVLTTHHDAWTTSKYNQYSHRPTLHYIVPFTFYIESIWAITLLNINIAESIGNTSRHANIITVHIQVNILPDLLYTISGYAQSYDIDGRIPASGGLR